MKYLALGSRIHFSMACLAIWHNEDGEAEIVEGHGRVLALKKLGIETAPVICLDHLTDEQRRAYTHVHNQTTLNSGFDYQTIVEDMDNLDMDWEALGFAEFMPKFDDDEEEPQDEEDVHALAVTPHCFLSGFGVLRRWATKHRGVDIFVS